MKKCVLRAVAIVLIMLMAINIVPVVSLAANAESQPMVLSVETVTGRPGETVQVKINLADNPGLASLQFNVVYDDILTLKDVVFNSAFGAYITAPQPYKNPQMITLISPLNDVTAEGTLATLTFEISENAADNYTAEIGITYRADDVYNGAYENIALSVEGGSVKVYHGIPGDIDADMQVNTKDAILLFRYIAGWDVTVDHAALDVNMDDQINTKDAITLFRYVAGWDVEIGRGTSADPGDVSSDTYTVQFYNGSTLIFEQTVNEGMCASAPTTPTKDGTVFLGWSGNYINVVEDETVHAVFSDEQNVFIVPTVNGQIGETVSVVLNIDGAVKVSGFDINITYDEALTLVSYDDDLDLDIMFNGSANENKIKLNTSYPSDRTKQRDIVELTFRINNTSKKALPITITVNSIKEIIDNNPADSQYTIVNGMVIVQ